LARSELRPFDLTGRTALVTGGSRGIGRAACLAFSRAGARVAVHYHREREAAIAEQAAGRISEDDPTFFGNDLGHLVDADEQERPPEEARPHLQYLGLVRALSVADPGNAPDPPRRRLDQEALAAAKPVLAPVARATRIARALPR
jgi:NAD(P)-dependent dehydrogenase (short-subunit alcohol dehydrogenase family)